MSFYQSIFTEATGITDKKHLNRIEEIVRMEYSTLDHLTRAKLKRKRRLLSRS